MLNMEDKEGGWVEAEVEPCTVSVGALGWRGATAVPQREAKRGLAHVRGSKTSIRRGLKLEPTARP